MILLLLFLVVLLLLLAGRPIPPYSTAEIVIPYDSFQVSDTVESKASTSTMKVQLNCLNEEFMSRLLEMKPVDLMGSKYVGTNCIVPNSKYLTVVPSDTDAVKLTINCVKNCLKFDGEKGSVRYYLNCKTGEYELLGTDDDFQCNFRDQKKKKIDCFDARNMNGNSAIVATSSKSQYLFLSSKLVKDGYPKLIYLELTMELDNGETNKRDGVNRYVYNLRVQILPFVFSKRCEANPKSGFERTTMYKLSCKDLSLYSRKGSFFYSISYKGSVSYIKKNEKLEQTFEASFTLPPVPKYHVDIKLYVYSVNKGKTCMEIISSFTYMVKPPILYGTLSQKIDRVSLSQDIGTVKKTLISLTSEVNERSKSFNAAYSVYKENEKEEGLKNLIDLRLKLLRKVYSLQVNKGQKLPELSTLLDEITRNKREFNATGKLVCSKIYSNFANQLKDEATTKPRESFNHDARYLVSGISHMLSSYEVEPRFEMTADEKSESIRMSIVSANQFLSAIDTISAAIWSVDRTSATVEVRSPISVLKVTKAGTSAGGICNKDVGSTLAKNNSKIFVVFNCQRQNNNTSKNAAAESVAFLSFFVIYNNPYDLAESQKPNYPVVSIRAYKDNAKYVDIGTKYIRLSGPRVPVNIKWKRFILRFDFRREGNFLYPVYSRNFSVPLVGLNSSRSSNHYIFVNLDKSPFHLDVAVHLIRKLSHQQFVSGNFERISESRVSSVNYVNYTVFVPVSSIKEKIYFVMVKPFENYTVVDDEMGRYRRNVNGNESHMEHVEISMHFGALSKSCLNWDNEHSMWSEKHCRLLSSSIGLNQSIACSCEHGSVLSASFLVPPNLVHPINDAYLFAEFFTNPIMFLVVLLAWVIYFGLLHLTRRLNRRDMESSSVTVLSNDLVGYIYLLCVKTKWWPGSGTTARVYLVLMGASVHSSVLYLRDSHKQCFQSGDENWFLLTTEDGIGDIKQILIWHDNSGSSPDWELDYVTIQDLQTKELWLFILSDWLSSNRGLFVTHTFLKPLSEKQQKSYRWKLFRLEVVDCFRRTHQWFSYIFTPPSSFSRAQRLTCTFALLLALMLGNIMFYGVPTDDPSKQLTVGSLTVSVTSLMIGLQTSLVIIPLGLVLTQLFIQVNPKSHSFLIVHNKKKTTKKTRKKPKPEIGEEDKKEKNTKKKWEETQQCEDAGKNGTGEPHTANKTATYSFWIHVRPSLNQNAYCILQKLIEDHSSSSSSSSRHSGAGSEPKSKWGEAADVHEGHPGGTAAVELKKKEKNEQESETVYLKQLNTDDEDVAQLPRKPDVSDGGEKEDKKEKKQQNESTNSLKHGREESKVKVNGNGVYTKKKKEEKIFKIKNPLKSHRLLPWWFVYISWTVTLSFCIVSTYFIMLYGFKYGYEMSFEWSVAFFTSLLQSIFLEQPFEILFQTALTVLVRMGVPKTELFHMSTIDENEKNFLTNVHGICYYEGNYPFVIHLPVLDEKRKRKKEIKTDNSPTQGPEKTTNFATA